MRLLIVRSPGRDLAVELFVSEHICECKNRRKFVWISSRARNFASRLTHATILQGSTKRKNCCINLSVLSNGSAHVLYVGGAHYDVLLPDEVSFGRLCPSATRRSCHVWRAFRGQHRFGSGRSGQGQTVPRQSYRSQRCPQQGQRPLQMLGLERQRH